MQKFTIDVQRTYTFKGTIEVEANSLEEAQLMGFNLINDTELSMDSFNEDDDTVNDQTFKELKNSSKKDVENMITEKELINSTIFVLDDKSNKKLYEILSSFSINKGSYHDFYNSGYFVNIDQNLPMRQGNTVCGRERKQFIHEANYLSFPENFYIYDGVRFMKENPKNLNPSYMASLLDKANDEWVVEVFSKYFGKKIKTN